MGQVVGVYLADAAGRPMRSVESRRGGDHVEVSQAPPATPFDVTEGSALRSGSQDKEAATPRTAAATAGATVESKTLGTM
jgi:hypothetical protein